MNFRRLFLDSSTGRMALGLLVFVAAVIFLVLRYGENIPHHFQTIGLWIGIVLIARMMYLEWKGEISLTVVSVH